MKKTLINTVTFLLCGAFFFTSCEDMLNVESDRVEYEYDDWAYTDSVYSVLGILKSVQKIGDRHILLGELRGDLVSATDKITPDFRDIMNFDFNAETNSLLAAKDYYSVINNCNIFLARVDTSLTYGAKKLMMREYIAVKSMRAWTYLQLMKNHEYIPFFTEPVTTHSKAEEVMNNAVADQITVIDKLIEDVAPYEAVNFETMDDKFWDIPDILNDAKTHKLFMPVRVLLGDLYLWRASLRAETASYPLASPNYDSDFAKAAKCYSNYLIEDNRYTDNGNMAEHTAKDPDEEHSVPNFKGYSERFFIEDHKSPNNGMIAVIRYAPDEKTGEVSNLADYFAPAGENVEGTNQLKASPAMSAISARQQYLYREYKLGSTTRYDSIIVESKDFPGDLRLFSTTVSQIGQDINATEYNGIIIKHNMPSKNLYVLNDANSLSCPEPFVETQTIVLDRPENIYLRFAEALMGLEREGWCGAKELAMTVLKSGVKKRYELYWDAYSDTIIVEDEYGNVVKEEKNAVKQEVLDETGAPVLDSEGNPTYITYQAPKKKVVTKSKGDFAPIAFDFSNAAFNNNTGIHSRGSGFSQSNSYYNLSDSCVAMYYGIPDNGTTSFVKSVLRNDDGSLQQSAKHDSDGSVVFDDATGEPVWEYVYAKDIEVKDYTISADKRIAYMYDKIIDEMALEMCWEGHRFGDLVRMATALANPDFLAMRVAARNSSDAPNWWTQGSGFDAALYGKLQNKSNWYLPLPDGFDPEEATNK